jgi:hypothetical protein
MSAIFQVSENTAKGKAIQDDEIGFTTWPCMSVRRKVAVGVARMVHAHQVRDGGVEIMNVRGMPHGDERQPCPSAKLPIRQHQKFSTDPRRGLSP